MPPTLPDQFQTPRLLLKRWRPDDAAALKQAIDDSLEHLQAWMPWAVAEPTPVEETRERLARFSTEFDAGHEWLYGIFSKGDGSLVGGLGVHKRSADPRTFELGYWLRRTAVGKAYAREAVEAASATVFTRLNAQRLEIKCDPANARSARVAESSGYTLSEIRPKEGITARGEPRDTMVWVREEQRVRD